jgi:hypothetical protein
VSVEGEQALRLAGYYDGALPDPDEEPPAHVTARIVRVADVDLRTSGEVLVNHEERIKELEAQMSGLLAGTVIVGADAPPGWLKGAVEELERRMSAQGESKE